jgi:hypothetical protein
MGWVEEAINMTIVPWRLQHKLYCFEEFQIISKNTFLKEKTIIIIVKENEFLRLQI